MTLSEGEILILETYAAAYKEGIKKSDPNMALSTRKKWVRDYAREALPDAVPYLDAFSRSLVEHRSPQTHNEKVGQAIVLNIRRLKLWPSRREQRRQSRKQPVLSRYEQCAKEFGWIPSDVVVALLTGTQLGTVEAKRKVLETYYEFEPTPHGYEVRQRVTIIPADPIITPETITQIATMAAQAAVEAVMKGLMNGQHPR